MKIVFIALGLLLMPVVFAGCSVRLQTGEEKAESVKPALQLDCRRGEISPWNYFYKCQIEGGKICYVYSGSEKGGVWCE